MNTIEAAHSALVRAMRNTEKKLDAFPFRVGVDVCCADCKYGSNPRYQSLIVKLKNQAAWLAILEAKLAAGKGRHV